MKRSAATVLQVVVVLIGIGALALLLWEPRLEGRNANATNFEIYFQDPFLAYAYTASIAFFVALHQAFQLLRYIARDGAPSQAALDALRTIRYCAISLVGFSAGAEAYFTIVMRRVEEDSAGGVMIGLVIMVLCVGVATAAALLEKRYRVRLTG